MKNLLLLALVLSTSFFQAQTPCLNGNAGGFPCDGLTLQSHIAIIDMGGKAYTGSNPMEATDSWGWTDPQDGKEYAIVCMNDGTAFVDISDPIVPRFLGRLESTTSTSWWRDVKVYNNYAYIVSDSNGNHGVQVFDLTKLRGLSTSPGANASMRTFTEDNHMTWGSGSSRGKAHNVIINEDSGYLYILGASTNSGGPLMVNIQNPLAALTYKALSGYGYCHDAEVVMYDGPDPDYQGKEILIGAFSNTKKIEIFDVTNKNAPVHISSAQYPNRYYTHQGWFTEDKRFFIVGDEVDEETIGGGTRTFVFDLEDLDNPSLYYTYQSPLTGAIDHNGYVVGNRFYLANYNAGLRVMKVDGLYDAVPSMTEVDFFDTHPSTDAATFYGAWNVYPFFASGNLIVSDLDEGLIIVKDPNFDNVDPVAVCQPFTATLNKNTGSVTITGLDLDGGSTDNFGIVKRTITAGQTTFTCDDVGSTFNVTLTVEDDYGNKDSCVAVVSVEGETTAYTSTAGGSWTNGTPDIGSHVKISYDYNTSTIGNSSIDACTCEIDAAKTLTIAAANYLNITKDITVNGNLVVEHTGSVVQSDEFAGTVNNGTINVELTTPFLKPLDFMIMGSPMTAETRANVFANAFMVRNHITANFVPNTEVAAAFPFAENFADDDGNNWVNFTDPIINPGEGYLVRPQSSPIDGNSTYNMTYNLGTLNSGDVNFDVGYNGTQNASPNVIANPYASALFAEDFINANSLVDALYFWEHITPPSDQIPGYLNLNFSMEDISMFNLTGGVAATNGGTVPNGYIATGQGFGFKANASGIATFSNSMRRKDNNNTLRNQTNEDRIWLKVSNEIYRIQSNTLIGFLEGATAGFDQGYDSKRLATVVSLYSQIENETNELGIQGREIFNVDMTIPLGFSTQIDADTGLQYTISIENIEGPNIENSTVYLVDNLLNITTNLSMENYEFTALAGTFDRRFTLQFESNTAGTTEDMEDSLRLFPNPTQGAFTIQFPNNSVSNAILFDAQGRVLLVKDFSENNNGERKPNDFYTLDISNFQTGLYFVQLKTSKGIISKQLIKK